MCRKLFILTSFILLVTFGVTTLALGVPLPSGSLKVGTVIDIGKELVSSSSMYNPRSFGGKNYIVQINNPQRGVGCYPSGSAIYEALANIGDGAELRMAGPFQAADYVLFSGGADNDYFSRIDPNLNLDTRVLAMNLDVRPSSYDWVDNDTIIHNSYKSGLRTNLYLTDINPDPFQVTANTSWNANSYVTTGATTRIRNVRVGDIYNGYAYYGDAGTNTAGFWVINLATGVSTQLGTLNVTGDGSWGLWTVKEVDGFLYVHTTHNGIYIYNMTDATTLGTLHTRYTKDKLDALAEDTNPNWGFDVVDDGTRMLLSAGLGKIIEIIDSRIASAPNPANAAADVKQTPLLKWSVGNQALSHQVYFGTDEEAVRIADTGSPEYIGIRELGSESYEPGKLQWDTLYYWRVDEINNINPESPWIGGVWSFTTANFFVVDDFEDYNDYPPDEIFSTWMDGYNVEANGALVGHDADFSKGEHIAETTIIHGGMQSMPYYYNNIGAAAYSEAERAFSPAQDWTREGVGVLSLWFRGYPAYLGSFVEGPTGTYTMTAEGADIWGNSDQFHFAYKELSGAGSIIAKVLSVGDTDPWAKAGVMIRDTLEPGSRHAMVVVTPGNGVAFQYRNNADGSSSAAAEETGITAPQWVKLERTVGGLVRSYYSADGNTWTQLGTAQTVTMNMPMYVGLALTSHNSGIACEAKFSNITSDGTGQWVDEDIGLLSNETEPMYVTVKDSSGKAATVYNDDPGASVISTWTEWKIDVKKFGDAGVVLTDVSNLAIGFGGADDPQPGGLGLVFFDDIRLYRPPEPEPAQ
jgi:hypothetical protein